VPVPCEVGLFDVLQRTWLEPPTVQDRQEKVHVA
jgi:hypothetical protein